MKPLNERIAEAVEAAKKSGHTIPEIAAACGVSKQSVYQWMKPGERVELEGTKLVELAAISGYSPMWIMCGKGVKLQSSPYRADPSIAAVVELMEASDATGRAIALNQVQVALSLYKPSSESINRAA